MRAPCVLTSLYCPFPVPSFHLRLTFAASTDRFKINPHAIVSDACTSYSTLESMNHALSPDLHDLVTNSDFFAYYRLNLFNKQCPFWNDEDAMCGNIACAVTTLDDESDIPPIWRMEELSKLEGPKAGHPGRRQRAERPQARPLEGMLGEGTAESCVVEYDDECDDQDYCLPEDESATGKGDYVSLVDNPERYTGYIGKSANQVWDAIYRENCFKRSSFPQSKKEETEQWPLQQGMSLPAAKNLRFVLEGGAKHAPKTSDAPSAETGFENLDECLEKRVFYRVVSGMHASISAHICWNGLNKTTGEWGPNLDCYKYRLHTHPERIANLYFNYALVVRAVAKSGPYLDGYTFCMGDREQDRETKEKVLEITKTASQEPKIFDESLMFVNGEGPSLKEDFRNRFRNISRLMDCVGCDKCRLWGKLQTQGYGTALKVLFEFDNPKDGQVIEKPQLRRTEVVALFNTLARISSSLSAVESFRDMIEAEEEASGCSKEGHYHKEAREKVDARKHKWGEDANAPLDPEKAPADIKVGEKNDSTQDEEDDVQDFLEHLSKHRDTTDESAWEAIKTESYIVWRVIKWIFVQWARFPEVAVKIVLNEAMRLWNAYIGLPVPARMWSWKFGSHDEL